MPDDEAPVAVWVSVLVFGLFDLKDFGGLPERDLELLGVEVFLLTQVFIIWIT